MESSYTGKLIGKNKVGRGWKWTAWIFIIISICLFFTLGYVYTELQAQVSVKGLTAQCKKAVAQTAAQYPNIPGLKEATIPACISKSGKADMINEQLQAEELGVAPYPPFIEYTNDPEVLGAAGMDAAEQQRHLDAPGDALYMAHFAPISMR